MDFEADRDTGPNGDPSLADMTKKALSIVQKNSKGFFLFVESKYKRHEQHNTCLLYTSVVTHTLSEYIFSSVPLHRK